MTNDLDPGWQPSLRNMIPFVGLIRVRRGGETNGLTILRTIFLAFVAALFLYFVAFSYIEPWDGGDERWLPWAVVAIGIVSLIWIARIRRRQLSTASAASLADSYRVLFFVGIAVAEGAALAGIAGVLLSRSLWLYLVGLPFALVGMWTMAPSHHDIQRRQRDITAAGSPLSLLDALISAPPPRP